MMSIFIASHQRKQTGNLELLSMLLLGLICGVCLSQLLQRARLHFYYDDVTDSQLVASSPFPSPSPSLSPSPNPSIGNATRILCLVVATVQHTRLVHIERTWGRRCNKLLLIGQQRGKQLNPLKERHTNSWAKTRGQLKDIYQQYYDDYDWFLKVPDNTYVIMENLRHFLQGYKPETPIYFGHNDWEQMQLGYVSGAAGYVLSKAALQRFVHLGHNNDKICSNRNYGIEHVEMARCFRNSGVIAGDSRDEYGLSRFLPIAPYAQPAPNNKSKGFFSKTAIAFHYSNVEDFYMLDYVIYRVRPFGLNQNIDEYQKMTQKLPSKMSDSDLTKLS